MKRTFLSACAAAAACFALTGATQAAPLGAIGSAVNAGVPNGDIQDVTHRTSRYCRWHDGERHCYNRSRRNHGSRYYGYNRSYGSGTGIYLNFGGRRNHHRDWDRHDRVYNNRNLSAW